MNTKNIIITVLAVVVVALLARYVVFKEKFENWGEGLQRVENWQNDYRKQHPGATDEEVNAAFKAGIANIEVWKEEYKRKNPGAADADADAAFEAAWKK